MVVGASRGELMDTASESFGRRLRFQRERRGIRLETISASTKINASLLRDLERDDVSKWPAGIFRRAFVREYAAAIGLAPEPVVAEFVKLFPDEGAPSGAYAMSSEPTSGLRLTLADDNAALNATVLQVLVATLELCAVVTIGRGCAWLAGLDFWTVCGIIALTYYPFASACFGRSPVLLWLGDKRQRRVRRAGQPVRSTPRDSLRLVMREAQVQRADVHPSAISHAPAPQTLQAASR
jgi:transcriptional regulator with XRE-family HTH domain